MIKAVKKTVNRWIGKVADKLVSRMSPDLLISRIATDQLVNQMSEEFTKRVMLTILFNRATAKRPPHRLFGDVNDDFWFWLNTEGARQCPDLAKVLPALPDGRTQLTFTGATGDATLAEAFAAYSLFKRLFEEHVGELDSSRRVLDFGCGWGRTIRFFLKDLEPANLWGVDCYEDVLNLARQTNRWAQFRLIEPRPPLAFDTGTFDLIYCYSVFSHLAEDVHRQWLAEFQRILKPGGLLIATTRPREFIETCDANLEKLPDWWVRHQVYADIPAMLARYDRGEYCYVATGGGGPLDKSFFGETCIPRSYVEQHWSRWFSVLDFVEDRSACPQNVIVVRK